MLPNMPGSFSLLKSTFPLILPHNHMSLHFHWWKTNAFLGISKDSSIGEECKCRNTWLSTCQLWSLNHFSCFHLYLSLYQAVLTFYILFQMQIKHHVHISKSIINLVLYTFYFFLNFNWVTATCQVIFLSLEKALKKKKQNRGVSYGTVYSVWRFSQR